MIQRIQTLYLFLGAVACAIPFMVGLPALEAGTPSWVSTLHTALYVLAGALGLVAIFLFKARDRQQIASFWAQISAAIALIVVIGMLLLYGASGTGIRSMVAGAENVVAVAAPLVGLVLFRSARSAIARDIKLIKSMDRLRD